MSTSAPNYIYPPLDADPTTLYNGFTAFMQASIPGWVPYSGELDDWLGRAFSAIAAQLTEITSDVATSIYRYFGAFIINLPPLAATSAQGTATFTVQDTVGYTIPAFTQYTFTDPTGAQQGFETLTDLVIAPGASTAAGVLVQAATAGAAGNGCTGTAQNASSLTYVTSVVLSAATSGGTDDEDDVTYLNRLTSELTTLTPSPITVTNFTSLALSQPLVGRAVTLRTFNPANATQTGNTHTSTTIDNLSNTALIAVGSSVSGSGVPGGAFVQSITSGTAIVISAATTTSLTGTTLTFGGSLLQGGEVTSWVTDTTGAALTSPQMATIQSAIQAMCLANVVYNVLAPTYTTINVVATVFAYPGQVTATVQAAVQAALNNYLSPLGWGQSLTTGQVAPLNGSWVNDNVVRVVSLEHVCMGVPGVHYVSSLTVNGGSDLTLGGVVPLPQAGTMTITVNSG